MQDKGSEPPQSLKDLLLGPLELLERGERWTCALIVACIFIHSTIDLASLALIIPLIGIVSTPSAIQEDTWIGRAFEYSHVLGVQDFQGFVLLSCGVLVLTFVVKATFTLVLALYQARFSFSIGLRLCSSMWSHHFEQSLHQLHRKETGQILTEVNIYPTHFASTFLVGNIKLLSDLILMSFILIGMLVYSPLILLSVGLLTGLCSLGFQTAIKHRIQHFSAVSRSREPETNSQINSAIRGFIELFTFDAMNLVKKRYLENNRVLYFNAATTGVLKQSPSKILEVVAAIAISSAIVISVLFDQQDERFLELLMVLTLSTYRIIPTLSRVNGQLIALQNAAHVQQAIKAGLQSKPTPQPAHNPNVKELLHVPQQVQVQLTGLGFSYSDKSRVFQNLNHTFEPGQLNAIVGESGAGKSTLLNTLIGMLRPDDGNILLQLDDRNCELHQDFHQKDWLRCISYVSQSPYFFAGTLEENLTFRHPDRTLNAPLVAKWIAALKLNATLGPEPLRFHIAEGGNNLSGGEKQRLALLRALLQNHPVLILDEATSALDTDNRDAVFQLLQKQAEDGINIILITHDRSLSAMCDSVLDLRKP